MGRNTYNSGLVTDEKWAKVSKQNKDLLNDFIDYCRAQDKSPQTIYQYESQLKIVMCYIMENLENRFFCDIKKREWVRFVSYLVNNLDLSSNRVSSIKSAISSFSNYIENILDDEYDYRNIIKSIPTPVKTMVRERDPLTDTQILACADELVKRGKYQVACFLALSFASGMRKAETIQMQLSDVSEESKIMDGKFYLTHTIRTKGRGSQGKLLKKYILCDILDPYLKLWLDERKKRGIVSPYLFVAYHDGEYQQARISTANSYNSIITEILGVNTSLHNLRHAWVDYLLRKGYPQSVVQKLQGWSGIQLVQYYSDISDQEELEDFFLNHKEENN